MSAELGSIDVHRVWKRFRADRVQRDLGAQLRHTVRHGWRRSHRWALADVSLAIEPGDAVALVGANGSGKSTLLKVVTGVMEPHAGRVTVAGRIGALIEVKAGIHPELTGRENIYLYGTLLGLSRRAVAARFDEIVAFADLEDSVDRQVKFYSSGMSMRLGFAVAAFLEPDILIVDEVLAVGDAAFQQRCLDRIRTVLGLGTTLLFVSHDLAVVESTCTTGLWVHGGRAAHHGPIGEVVGAYRSWVEDVAAHSEVEEGDVMLVDADAGAGADGGEGPVHSGGPLHLSFTVSSREARPVSLCVGISEGTASPTIFLRRPVELPAGTTVVECEIESLPLAGGRYFVWAGALDKKLDVLPWRPVAAFDVAGPPLDKTPSGIVRLAPIHVQTTWVERR